MAGEGRKNQRQGHTARQDFPSRQHFSLPAIVFVTVLRFSRAQLASACQPRRLGHRQDCLRPLRNQGKTSLSLENMNGAGRCQAGAGGPSPPQWPRGRAGTPLHDFVHVQVMDSLTGVAGGGVRSQVHTGQA